MCVSTHVHPRTSMYTYCTLIYMCVHPCTPTHIHVHLLYTPIHVCPPMYTHVHINIYTSTPMYLQVYTPMYSQVHSYTCMYTYVLPTLYTYIEYVCQSTLMYTHTHQCTSTYHKWGKICWAKLLQFLQFLIVPRKFSCEYLAVVK